MKDKIYNQEMEEKINSLFLPENRHNAKVIIDFALLAFAKKMREEVPKQRLTDEQLEMSVGKMSPTTYIQIGKNQMIEEVLEKFDGVQQKLGEGKDK